MAQKQLNTMGFLDNLRQQELKTGVQPWEFMSSAIPENVRADKAHRDAWINNPDTVHHVYSCNEGSIPNQRISRPRNDSEGNPVATTLALVADFDEPLSQEVLFKRFDKLPWKPNWVEHTLSGNWRLIWLLEIPLRWPSHDFAKHFFRNFEKFGFDVSKAGYGFDRAAWEAPERLWTNSGEWVHVHDAPIPADVVQGWLVKASEGWEFDSTETGGSIPLDIVKAELAKKFPSFASWPGDFVLNAQGPTFWVEGSASPKSAIVRQSGMQTFSAHAVKAFYHWRELLGIDFCKKYESEYVGRAVRDIYFDGRDYHRKQPNNRWEGFGRLDTILHLRTTRNVSPKTKKDGTNDVDTCLEFIHNQQRVTSAGPALFMPPGPYTDPHTGETKLNTSSRKVMQPCEGDSSGWGDRFPLLARYFESLFAPVDGASTQNDIFQAWNRHFYRGAYYQQPTKGHGLALVGGVGVGKSLLFQVLLGGIYGGFEDAYKYLMGEDNFGGELFEAGIMTVEDGAIAKDPRGHRRFSEGLKRLVADRDFKSNKKFKQPSMVYWNGRVCVSLNDDPESLRMIPNLDISILDKLLLLRCVHETTFQFTPELVQKMRAELPYYLRWLLQSETAPALLGEARFGIKSYQEPSLVRSASQSSEIAGWLDILMDWVHEHFTVRAKADETWSGTTFQLRRAMCQEASTETMLRRYSQEQMTRLMASCLSRAADLLRIDSDDSGATRIWTIHRPANM